MFPQTFFKLTFCGCFLGVLGDELIAVVVHLTIIDILIMLFYTVIRTVSNTDLHCTLTVDLKHTRATACAPHSKILSTGR